MLNIICFYFTYSDFYDASKFNLRLDVVGTQKMTLGSTL